MVTILNGFSRRGERSFSAYVIVATRLIDFESYSSSHLHAEVEAT